MLISAYLLRSAINLWHNIEYILIYVSICDVLIIIFLAVFFCVRPLLCGYSCGISVDSSQSDFRRVVLAYRLTHFWRRFYGTERGRRRKFNVVVLWAINSVSQCHRGKQNTRHVCPDDVAVESGSIFRGSTVGGCSLVNWALDCQPSCT